MANGSQREQIEGYEVDVGIAMSIANRRDRSVCLELVAATQEHIPIPTIRKMFGSCEADSGIRPGNKNCFHSDTLIPFFARIRFVIRQDRPGTEAI